MLKRFCLSLPILFLLVITCWQFANAGATALVSQEAPLPTQGGRNEVQLELGSTGFTPTQLQHSSGTFPIAIDNKALSGTYTVQLKAADGTLLYSLVVEKGSVAWTVSLQTGQYTISVVDHPDWLCRLSVQ